MMTAQFMQALRWHQRADLRIDKVPRPHSLASTDVRIVTAACGICGSDLHEYLTGPFEIPIEPHPATGASAPLILGHEVSGWVTSVGAEVTNVAVGDLVALNAHVSCWRCDQCLNGSPHRCRNLGHLGQTMDGGLCESLVVPAEMAVAASSEVDPSVLALAEPFAVAIHALRAVPRLGDQALITGAGTIGLAIGLLLKERDIPTLLIEPATGPRLLAERLGLQTATSPTGAPPATVAFECSGAGPAINELVQALDSGGELVLVGLPDGKPGVDIATIVHRELTVRSSVGHTTTGDLVPAVDFIERHVDAVAALISCRVTLDGAVDAIARLGSPDSPPGKTVVEICPISPLLHASAAVQECA